MLIHFWEYFTKPEKFKVRTDLSYERLRVEVLDLISQLPDGHQHKERLGQKIHDLFPSQPKRVTPYKKKLQQLHRRVERMVNG